MAEEQHQRRERNPRGAASRAAWNDAKLLGNPIPSGSERQTGIFFIGGSIERRLEFWKANKRPRRPSLDERIRRHANNAIKHLAFGRDGLARASSNAYRRLMEIRNG